MMRGALNHFVVGLSAAEQASVDGPQAHEYPGKFDPDSASFNPLVHQQTSLAQSIPPEQHHRHTAVQCGELTGCKGPADIDFFTRACLLQGVPESLSSRHVLYHAAGKGEKSCFMVLEIRR